jgi:hypothetical protein
MVRLFLVNQRRYTLMTRSSTKAQATDTDVARFMDSFQLLE